MCCIFLVLLKVLIIDLLVLVLLCWSSYFGFLVLVFLCWSSCISPHSSSLLVLLVLLCWSSYVGPLVLVSLVLLCWSSFVGPHVSEWNQMILLNCYLAILCMFHICTHTLLNHILNYLI